MIRLSVLFFRLLIVLVPSLVLFGTEGQIAKTSNIEIWYETFGQKENPSLLLVMGCGGPGIMWPTEFCEQLSHEGFYVIRYDHRDVGLSTSFDFDQNPYDLLDMAKDAIELVDYIGVEKTHLLGLSMGGPIAELISVHFPKRILSLTVMMTPPDFRPLLSALDGLPSEEGSLSSPRENYLEWMKKLLQTPPQSEEELLEQRLEGWRILNGSAVPFDETLYRELHKEFISRTRNPKVLANHILACKRSQELIRSVPSQVKVPTWIFLGSEDPIFPPDHGEALAKAITGSTYVFVKGMGHVPNCHFYDILIEGIKKNSHIKEGL